MSDPLICCAKCFSSWASIQTLMSFIIIWCVILVGLSGWLSESNGGDFSGITIGNSQPYSDWAKFCDSSPYFYLRPFQFTYTAKGVSSSTSSICPFPDSNSEFRLVICVFAIVSVFALFFHTPLSFAARQVFVMYALLFFAAGVLDVNAVATGYATCGRAFANTDLNDSLTSNGITLTCNQNNFAGLCVIDFIVSGFFFFIYTAWLFCKDKYVRPTHKHSADQKSLLGSHNAPSKV